MADIEYDCKEVFTPIEEVIVTGYWQQTGSNDWEIAGESDGFKRGLEDALR